MATKKLFLILSLIILITSICGTSTDAAQQPVPILELGISDTAGVVDYENGIYVVGTSGGDLYVINEAGEYTVTALGAGSISDVRIENPFIAVAADSSTVVKFLLNGLTPVEQWRRTVVSQVKSVDISGNGAYVAYLSTDNVGVFDSNGTLEDSYSISGAGIVWWLDATDDMEYIAITAEVPPYAGTNSGVELYRFDGNSISRQWGKVLVTNYETTEVRISEAKDYVAVATSSGTYMNLVDLTDGNLLWQHETPNKEQYACDGDDNLKYVIGANQAWSPPYPWFVLKNLGTSYQVIADGNMNGPINDLDSNPDSSLLAFGSDTGEFILLRRSNSSIDTIFEGDVNDTIAKLIDAIEIGNISLLVGGQTFINLYAYSTVILEKVDDVNDGDCVGPGREITYTIDYNYPAGPNLPDINDVNIIDYLPSEVNYVSSDPCGVYDSNTHTVTWNIGTLHPGDFGSVTLKVIVNPCVEPGITITNECDIKSGYDILGFAYEYTPVCYPTLTKVDNISSCVSPGETITYSICYAAHGYGDTSVVITDSLPNEVNFISASGDYEYNSGIVTWNIGTLEPNESGCVTLTVKVNTNAEPGRIITNCSQMSGNCIHNINACENTPVCCWYIPVIYVDANAAGSNNGTSWANAYKYLQDALQDVNISACCEEIWVAAGTYKPDKGVGIEPNDRNATFSLINNVAIYGGFPPGGGAWESRDPNIYKSILSGDINVPDVNNDNSYHVVTANSVNETAILDGFTITAGLSGGMYNLYGSPMITNCTFSGNTGGGMYNNYSGPIVTNCTFSGNSASNGGGMYNYKASPTVTNCTFSGNSASNGGGMDNENHSGPIVTNCTFSGNSATYGGGMSNNDNSNSMVTNCILWGNTASNGSQIYNYNNSYPTVTYSDIQGGWSAAGWDPNTDPCLVFNLDFETDTNSPLPPTTTEAGPLHLIGIAYDYNDHDPNNLFHMWNAPTSRWRAGGADTNDDPNAAKIGNFVGDFRKPCDYNIGKAFDACVMVPGNEIFVLGNVAQRLTTQRTFTFWFWPEAQTISGTFIRHANIADPNYWWEIRVYDGKLQFWSKMGDFGVPLRMETTKTLAQLGVQVNSWHHAAIVYNRYSRETSLMFVDGVQVDRTVISYNSIISANVDPDYDSPVTFGTGDSEFDGMLDEFRIYHRVLTPSDVRILYRYPYTVPLGTNINADPCFVDADGNDNIVGTIDDNLRLLPNSPCIDVGDNNSVPRDYADLDDDGNTIEPTPYDLDGRGRITDGNDDGYCVVDMGAYEHSAPSYVITATAGPNGSIEPAGEIIVDCGSDVNFTATPNTCYKVDKWYLDGNSVQTDGNTYTLTNITADHTVNVTFSKLSYTVTASADANGSVEPNGPIIVDCGSDVNFTATPNTCYKVDKWYLDGNSVQTDSNTYTLTNITADHTVNVTFSMLYIGDFDGSCDVDFQDFAILASAWLTEEGQTNYKTICDISLPADKKINMLDLEVFCEHWLEGTAL